MITHDNICFEAENAQRLIAGYGEDPVNPDRIISYLPLSHVAGMMVDIVGPLITTAFKARGDVLVLVRCAC